MTQEEIVHLLECAEAKEDVYADRAWSEARDAVVMKNHTTRSRALRDAIAIIKAAGPTLIPDEDDEGYPLVMKQWGRL